MRQQWQRIRIRYQFFIFSHFSLSSILLRGCAIAKWNCNGFSRLFSSRFIFLCSILLARSFPSSEFPPFHVAVRCCRNCVVGWVDRVDTRAIFYIFTMLNTQMNWSVSFDVLACWCCKQSTHFAGRHLAKNEKVKKVNVCVCGRSIKKDKKWKLFFIVITKV